VSEFSLSVIALGRTVEVRCWLGGKAERDDEATSEVDPEAELGA
jgi:hypothetical protein